MPKTKGPRRNATWSRQLVNEEDELGDSDPWNSGSSEDVNYEEEARKF